MKNGIVLGKVFHVGIAIPQIPQMYAGFISFITEVERAQ